MAAWLIMPCVAVMAPAGYWILRMLSEANVLRKDSARTTGALDSGCAADAAWVIEECRLSREFCEERERELVEALDYYRKVESRAPEPARLMHPGPRLTPFTPARKALPSEHVGARLHVLRMIMSRYHGCDHDTERRES